MMNQAKVDARSLFQAHGLRCTDQRLALYDALIHTKRHPTAEQLFQEVGQSLHGISLATVYNTLEAFCRVGLAQKLPPRGEAGYGNDSAHYDAMVEDHVHLRCRRSGQVCDLSQAMSRQVIQNLTDSVRDHIREQLGFDIKHVSVELIGEFER